MKNSVLITEASGFAEKAVSQGSIIQHGSGTTRKKDKDNVVNAGYIRNLALAAVSALTTEGHSVISTTTKTIKTLFLNVTNRLNTLSEGHIYAFLPELNKLKE